ncbi:hypothetical protein GQ42DRAFT_165831 [Ramicandelaber brevisporus]|nr:hypothetical protein GQ42DRAFT_165831 [Ramicandelaber brevisporus]
MNDLLYFGNFYLPYDAAELVSFFFDSDEAHKPLIVSTAFHNLFARRVWWKLDSRVFTLSEPTRSMAIARYGNLVRYIELDEGICSAVGPDVNTGVNIYEVLSVFSSVTTLNIRDDHDHLFSNGIEFKDIIMCFPKLFKLDIIIEEDREPYDLVTLVHAIGYRQRNSSINHIICLNLEYSISSSDIPWALLSNFAQSVVGHRVKNVRITPLSTTSSLPSKSDLQFLSKYFTCRPEIKRNEDTLYCYADLNRSLFWKIQAHFFYFSHRQPRHLSLRTCCASPFTYDYDDITPSNFPYLQSMVIHGHECSHMISLSYSTAWEKVLLQTWPYLKDLTVSCNMPRKRFVTMLKYNCSLTGLSIQLHPKMLDRNNAFNLAMVIPLLRKMQHLTILGNNEMRLDYSPGYDDYDILLQSELNTIQFFGLDLSSRIINLLYSLPKVSIIHINSCKLYSTDIGEALNLENLDGDPNEIVLVNEYDASLYDELMSTLGTFSAEFSSSNPCIIKEFTLSIGEDDEDWPLDFTLGMIELAPELRIFTFTGESDETPNAVNERFPYIKVTHNS